LGVIEVPEQPSNCTFGGADGKTLYVTARTSLYSFPMHVKGHWFAQSK
jgi:gluconolactonase